MTQRCPNGTRRASDGLCKKPLSPKKRSPRRLKGGDKSIFSNLLKKATGIDLVKDARMKNIEKAFSFGPIYFDGRNPRKDLFTKIISGEAPPSLPVANKLGLVYDLKEKTISFDNVKGELEFFKDIPVALKVEEEQRERELPLITVIPLFIIVKADSVTESVHKGQCQLENPKYLENSMEAYFEWKNRYSGRKGDVRDGLGRLNITAEMAFNSGSGHGSLSNSTNSALSVLGDLGSNIMSQNFLRSF